MIIEIDKKIDDPNLLALIERHHIHCESQTPPESCHRLDVSELRAHDVEFYVAREDGEVVGMAALKRLGKTSGELKSMHVLSEKRGHGGAQSLLDFVFARARSIAMTNIYLETGNTPNFDAAVRFYEKSGFVKCEPFTYYQDDPNSIFMKRSI